MQSHPIEKGIWLMKVRSHSDLYLRNQHFAHVTGFQVALKINRYVFSIVLLTVSLLLLAKAHWKSRYSARCRKQLNIAGFPHRNQEAAVRWSSRRFGLSIRKEGQLQLLDLLNSVLGRAGKSRNSKNSAAQPLLSSSYRKSVSSSDRSMTSSLQQQTLNNGPSSTATLAVLVLKHMAP